MYCVIVGDIIHSKTLDPSLREESTQIMNQILEQINFKYSGRILAPFGIVRGDAFEGVLYSQADAPAIIQDILKFLYTKSQIRVRVSSATGDLTVVSSERNKADGEAFHIALARIEDLRRNRSDHWFQVTMYTNSVAQPLVDGLLELITALTQSWTVKQTQAVWAMLDCSNQQNLAAQRLGITPPAIHKHLKAASFDAYRHAWESLEQYMADLDQDAVKPKQAEVSYTTYFSLAQQEMQNGSYAEAIESFQLALNLAIEKFGEGHPNLADIYNSLTWAYLSRIELLDASDPQRTVLLRLADECVETSLACQKDLPKLRVEYIDALNQKGIVMQEAQKKDEALENYRQAVQLAQDLYGEGHPLSYIGCVNIGDLLQSEGRYQEALEECQAALTHLQPWKEPYAEAYATALLNIGDCQYHLGNLPAAAEALREALTAFSSIFPEKHPRITQTRALLEQAEASQNPNPTQKEVT